MERTSRGARYTRTRTHNIDLLMVSSEFEYSKFLFDFPQDMLVFIPYCDANLNKKIKIRSNKEIFSGTQEVNNIDMILKIVH